MKLDEFVSHMEERFPVPDELKFEKSGVLSPPDYDIGRVSVAVDLTEHVLKKSQFWEQSMVVVHNPPSQELLDSLILPFDQYGDFNIGVYLLHLPLDTMRGGLISSMVEAMGLQFMQSVDIEYRGHTVQNGAVVGTANFQLGLAPVYLEHLIGAIRSVYGIDGSEGQMKVHNGDARRYATVAMSTGYFGREDFMQQLEPYKPDVLITGCAKEDGLQYAKNMGITVVEIGDYESHLPGMRRFAGQLAEVMKGKIGVRFIPNTE